MEEIVESIYDHPKYYDLVFGSDCAAELRFIEAVNERFLGGRAKRMYEPACGTGRLLYRLARRGYEVGGIDLNLKAIEFCNQRLQRAGFPPSTYVGDMSHFEVSKKWDLAFNTINSFRHLSTQRQAIGHLRSMASAIRSGGLYLLGLHVRPTQAAPSETEAWVARRGDLQVNTYMWTIDRNIPERMERFGIYFDVYTPLQHFRITDELRLRSYTDRELRRLVKDAGGWEIIETYSFHYDIDDPIEVDETCEDVVYVLKRVADR